MTYPTTLISQAKDGYELSLAMLAIFILAFAWVAIKFLEISKAQDLKDSQNLERLELIAKTHSEQIERIHLEHSNRVERLIESHRLEVSTTLDKLTSTLHELHVAIEKRNVRLTDEK
jgi:hypothetical protein